ncbi:MAG: transglycosylase SLT domain-containing protein [Pararobbsia sp.]
MSKSLVRVYRAVAAVIAGAVLVACSNAAPLRQSAAGLSPDDQTFIALRDAARQNDEAQAASLAARLPNYPVPSYVEYFALKPLLFDNSGHANIGAPDDAILAFLGKYDGLAIADRLRNDYLLVLGARHDWRNFDSQYKRFVLDDDTQVKCYALESRAARGENVTDAARTLLVEPKNYGDACVDLVTALAAKGQMTTEDVWQQIRIAYEDNYVQLGNRLADALGAERPDDTLLDLAASKPPLLLARGVAMNTPSHQLALLAITRMARNDPSIAAATFSSIAPALAPQERAIGWGTIAYQAALKQVSGAADWYRLSVGAPLSYPAFEWRVRAALALGDWTMVRWASEAMPAPLRARPAWVYWHGRALKALGDTAGAAADFALISARYDFYGQLATEELGGQITLPPRTVTSADDIRAVRDLPGFALAQRFYAMNLRFEGNREWNWTLRGMSDRQLLAAAAYAKSIELYDREVNTADRTQQEHDFTLRYATPFKDIVERDARQNDLDVEWAYGLIRQESRFVIAARSGVGAQGLMQLMPGTANLVARKIGLGALSFDQMSDIDTNILLGTTYLSMVYNQFDGSAVLASAGYNAGPGRPRQWRAALSRPVEGAIFAETIPFTETRDYVKNVLSNTVYYAALLEGKPQSLKVRLGYIEPAD